MFISAFGIYYIWITLVWDKVFPKGGSVWPNEVELSCVHGVLTVCCPDRHVDGIGCVCSN